MRPRSTLTFVLVFVLHGAAVLGAEPAPSTDAASVPSATSHPWPHLASGPLQDNSFFIEEAYNQEAGVVQHIATAVRDQKTHTWVAVFTQESPLFSQDHQLSYLVPYQSAGDGDDASGVGDVFLNYRYQLIYERAERPACAPRLSLILPTGSVDDDLGRGSAGLQVAVPVSKQINDHLAAHLNVGTTIVPDAHAASGPPRREWLTSWLVGGSVIWEPVDAINLLCEVIATDDADVGVHGVNHSSRVAVSPGVRVGWNGPAGTQWVWGIAAPIGLTRKTDDVGILLYFSLEHAFTAAAGHERWP